MLTVVTHSISFVCLKRGTFDLIKKIKFPMECVYDITRCNEIRTNGYFDIECILLLGKKMYDV